MWCSNELTMVDPQNLISPGSHENRQICQADVSALKMVLNILFVQFSTTESLWLKVGIVCWFVCYHHEILLFFFPFSLKKSINSTGIHYKYKKSIQHRLCKVISGSQYIKEKRKEKLLQMVVRNEIRPIILISSASCIIIIISIYIVL